MNDVVITGIGIVSPLGTGSEAFTAALLRGESVARPITGFEANGFPVRIACEVDEPELPVGLVPPKSRKLMSRATLFAALASVLARREAQLGAEDVAAERLGVVFGAGGMGAVDPEFLELEMRTLRGCEEAGGFTWERFCEMYQRFVNPLTPIRGLPNLTAGTLGILHDAQGCNLTVATACASGTQAIGEALRALRRGEADVILTGGTDAMINPTGILGFHLLGALSRRNADPTHASRPFDRDRDGFVMGEGAAAFVLEREEFATARGAPILGRVLGFASTCDAYRMTDERPDAGGAIRAMRGALRDADLSTTDIGYINAHGTGTVMNDRLETLAVRTVFGGAAPPASSTKSMHGHLLAGAGAIEAAATVLALRRQRLPPTINHDTPDPECDIDCVPNRARPSAAVTALSNSFGFGGQNACLALSANVSEAS
jgi:3-oxoacyl-[acyl-carrier-protein] synthase II